MNSLISHAPAILGAVALIGATSIAAEKFQKLSGPQIRATLAGMEISDGIHSSDIFQPNGVLVTIGMGRKTIGKWRVQKDEICLDRPKEESFCYEVWIAGKKAELRRRGSDLPFVEGVLQRPKNR